MLVHRSDINSKMLWLACGIIAILRCPCLALEGGELFKPGFYKNGKQQKIWDTEAKADKRISFASTDKVECGYSGNWKTYISPNEMLTKLQQETKKDLLVIHLEKRFEYFVRENRKSAHKRVIRLAKKTGFKRCLILIDSSLGVRVLDDLICPIDDRGEKTKGPLDD